jgi:DNA-binding NtrC family response regulator
MGAHSKSVGVVCFDGAIEAALEVIGAMPFVLMWAVGSAHAASVCLARVQPSVIVLQFAGNLPEFWDAVERFERASPQSGLVVVGAPTDVETARLANASVVSTFEDLTVLFADLAAPKRQRPAAAEGALLIAAHRNTGYVGVKEAQKALRIEMFREALRRVNGNRHAAARLLQVDRR